MENPTTRGPFENATKCHAVLAQKLEAERKQEPR
jgi:hypothetical protein